jgi:ComF family protein
MSLLDRVISFVAPSQCLACGTEGTLLCQGCAARCFQQPPIVQLAALHGVWSRTVYNKTAKQLIHAYKFERAQYAAPTIAKLMADALPPVPPNTLLVPVPTATSRYRQRGYDHAYLLAKALAGELKLPSAKLLTRMGQTRQVGASKSVRHSQLQDAFRLTGRLPPGQAVLLVDDVVTTGASLEAAARVLQKAGVKAVYAITFAQKIKAQAKT